MSIQSSQEGLKKVSLRLDPVLCDRGNSSDFLKELFIEVLSCLFLKTDFIQPPIFCLVQQQPWQLSVLTFGGRFNTERGAFRPATVLTGSTLGEFFSMSYRHHSLRHCYKKYFSWLLHYSIAKRTQDYAASFILLFLPASQKSVLELLFFLHVIKVSY